RIRKIDGPTPIWETAISGDPLVVERSLLDQFARVLERAILLQPLTASELLRLQKVPTTSGDALMAYSQARALIGPSNSAETTDRAIALLQDAVAKDSTFALAYASLGDAYWQKYQRTKTPDLVGKATAAVNEALRLDPDQAAVHYSLGNMYQQTGRYEDAITALSRAIQIQPDDDESHALLARVLAAKGDYRRASEEARRAVDIRPGWTGYFNQGRVELAGGHLDKALVAFRRTTELNPGFAGGFQMLGAAYQMTGDLDNAIGNYEHSIRLEPNAPAYSNLGIAYLRARRYTEAIAAYTEAISRDPQQPSRYRNLADAFKAAGRFDEARDNYAKALALAQRALVVNPRDAVMIALEALCEANLGRHTEARGHAAEAASVGEASGDARFRLTKVYLALDDRPAALAALRAAVAVGYDQKAAREDDDLAPLRGPDFDAAIAEGLAARRAGGR
ncbi:MAG TPA: tetratricopeptide repeat protein, partial [Vicinamibacterales bacterium]|nr:tetratricopeptide repeat protein [Vicinamibacterales bacterium]